MEVDELGVAATAERPPADPLLARRALRRPSGTRQAAVAVDDTSEVQLEDILLEVYATPSTIVPPPYPHAAVAVDALLRASDPAFLPYRGYPPPGFEAPRTSTPPSFAPAGYGSSDEEAHSVAPVAFPSIAMMVATPPPLMPYSLAAHQAQNAPTIAPRSRGIAYGLGVGALLLVVTGAAGAGITLGLRIAPQTELRAKPTPAGNASPPRVAPAVIAPSLAAPAPSPAVAAPLTAVSVSSLPKSSVAANETLVTFPASAQGHRVFFDGRPIAVTPEPMTLRCGRHMIRIGSAGKPRVRDLACGGELTLPR